MIITSRLRASRRTTTIAISSLVMACGGALFQLSSAPEAMSTTTPAVTLHRSGTAAVGHRITLSGAVRAAKPGTRAVLVQRSFAAPGAHWRTIARPILRADRTYSAPWTPTSAAHFRLRAVRVPTATTSRAVSAVTAVTVSPSTRPAATATGVCSSPKYQTRKAQGSWNPTRRATVHNNVWGPSGSNWSQHLSACSAASWKITANFQKDGGAIQSYPDTEFHLPDKAVAKYKKIRACFGEQSPTGGEWDYGYDMWLGDDRSYNDHWQTEIMVWNDWTDTNIYPPTHARAVKIGGVGYHMWKGGGQNEWIYTRDHRVKSGCVDMLGIYRDLIAHPSSSGMTKSIVPWSIEYGVEVASTKGPETFKVTNASVTTG